MVSRSVEETEICKTEALAGSDSMQTLPNVIIKKKPFMSWCSYPIPFGMDVRVDLPVIVTQRWQQSEH